MIGIDVSHWQGKIPWPLQGVDFAVIKTSGGDVGLYTDSMFMTNNLAVVQKGIPHGFYHYIGGIGAEAEASYFLSTLGQLDAGEFLALDFEINLSDPVSYVKQMAQIISDKIGLKPFIYLNSSTCSKYNWQSLVDMGCPLWIANYGVNNGNQNAQPGIKYWTSYAMWQYTSKGVVPGISGNVDKDLFNGSVNQLKAYGFQKPKGVPTVTPEQDFNNLFICVTGNWPPAGEYAIFQATGLSNYAYIQQKYLYPMLNGYRDQISNLSIQNTTLQNQITSLSSQVDGLNNQVKTLSDSIVDYQNKYKNDESHIDYLNDQITDLKHQLAEASKPNFIVVILNKLFGKG